MLILIFCVKIQMFPDFLNFPAKTQIAPSDFLALKFKQKIIFEFLNFRAKTGPKIVPSDFLAAKFKQKLIFLVFYFSRQKLHP